MYLSDHFTLDEMTRTEVRWAQDSNKEAAVQYIPVLKRLCEELMEPVRALFPNAPINVHSGFRCSVLNHAIGGSPTSQHMVGEAVDFDIAGQVDPESLKEALHVILGSGIKFRQLLIESGCLHISLPTEDGPNGEVAYWDKGIKVSLQAAG